MIKYINLTFSLLLLYNFSQAQNGRFASKIQSLDIMLSQKTPQTALYDQLNSPGSYDFKKTLTYIGIAYGGTSVVNKKYYISGYNSFSMLIPRNITVADTIYGKMTGFNVGLSLFGIDILHQMENLDLLLSAGFNTGRLRMYGNDQIRQKNAYFSPKTSYCIRGRIKDLITISLNVEYEYDVSKPGWRRTWTAPKNGINIQNFRQSGFTASFTIGFKVYTQNSPVPPAYDDEDKDYKYEEEEETE